MDYRGYSRSLFLIPPGAEFSAPGADALILDLCGREPESTPAELAVREVWLRVEGVGSPGFAGIVEKHLSSGVTGVILSAVNHLSDLDIARWWLREVSRRKGLNGDFLIIPTVSTAAAVEDLGSILADAGGIHRLCLDAPAYARSLGIRWDGSPQPLRYARSRLVSVSRAAGIGPPVEYGRDDRVREDCLELRSLGFGGRITAAPEEISVINAVFATDDPEKPRWLRLLVEVGGEPEVDVRVPPSFGERALGLVPVALRGLVDRDEVKKGLEAGAEEIYRREEGDVRILISLE